MSLAPDYFRRSFQQSNQPCIRIERKRRRPPLLTLENPVSLSLKSMASIPISLGSPIFVSLDKKAIGYFYFKEDKANLLIYIYIKNEVCTST